MTENEAEENPTLHQVRMARYHYEMDLRQFRRQAEIHLRFKELEKWYREVYLKEKEA